MSEKLTVCTFEICGHATEELKTAGKTVMLTEFIENCKTLDLDQNLDLFCDWPHLSGLFPSCDDDSAFYNPCSKTCANPDCFESDVFCNGDEELVPLCECLMGFIMNDGYEVIFYTHLYLEK